MLQLFYEFIAFGHYSIVHFPTINMDDQNLHHKHFFGSFNFTKKKIEKRQSNDVLNFMQ